MQLAWLCVQTPRLFGKGGTRVPIIVVACQVCVWDRLSFNCGMDLQMTVKAP